MPISRPPERTVIIVPIYKASLSETEELVIRYSLSTLKKHDVYFVAPTILKLDWYQKFLISAKYLICPDEYFTSPQAYSKLMLGAGFYQYFSSKEPSYKRGASGYRVGKGSDFISSPPR